MKKFISIFITVAMLVTMFGVMAAENELDIQYSINNGETWQSVPGFEAVTTAYNIILPANVLTVNIRAIMPDEGLWWTTCRSFTRDGIVGSSTNYNTYRNGEPLIGDFYTQKVNTGYNKALTYEGRTNNNIVPIILEETRAYVYYKAVGATSATKYQISFYTEKQPRLTEYNINTTVFPNNDPIPFISGAATFNDNRSILDSYANGSTSGQGRTWALANISESLEGASMFVLPFTSMVKSGSGAINNPTQELFNFKADTAGKVVILTKDDVSPTSVYRTAGTDWEAGEGSGNQPNGITTFSSPRNKNNYSNIKYAALAYKWIGSLSSSFPATDPYNAYRLDNPGINMGNIVNGTHVKDNVKLVYSYEKSFEAGESVSIGNIGTFTASDASENLMAVFVIWDIQPHVTLNSVQAVNDNGDLYIITDTSSQNTATSVQDMYAAIYSDGKMTGLRIISYSDGENSFLFENTELTGNETVKILALNTETLKPLILNNYSYLASDILN